MRLPLRILTAVSVLAISTLAAHADTFQYSILLQGDTVVFNEPSILQTDTIINSPDFISSTNAEITSAEIDPTAPVCSGHSEPDSASCVAFQLSNNVLDFAFYPTPLNTTGTFTIEEGDDEVVITDLGPSPVPEPSTFVFLGTGILGLAGAARRKFLNI
jgi:PEP-CTERM motif